MEDRVQVVAIDGAEPPRFVFVTLPGEPKHRGHVMTTSGEYTEAEVRAELAAAGVPDLEADRIIAAALEHPVK